ncbi:MAG: thioesterase family protein [Bacteroidota bacterium]
MKKNLEAGITHTEAKEVRYEDTAANYGSGLVEVFATPAMISLMENTALKTVLPYLSDNQNTVGFEVNVKHLKPTPVGKKVECTSVLKEVDGKKLVFDVEVKDEEDIVGKGVHTRFIINTQKFMNQFKTE